MQFRRSAIETIRVPLSEVRATELEKAKALRVRKASFELILRDIQATVKGYPRLQMSEGSLSSNQSMGDYRFHLLTAKRHQAGKVRAAKFNDGIAVAFTTESWLEDKAHYLVAPTDGPLVYGEYAINVDCQTLGSKPRVFRGPEKLSEDESAIRHLSYCAGALAVESVTGWQNALQATDLARIRWPDYLNPEQI